MESFKELARAGAGDAPGSVLDLDPDLAGDGIAPEDWPLARRACTAQVLFLGSGAWDPRAAADALESFAFVLVDLMIVREVVLKDRYLLELLGPGDVLLPPTVAAWPLLSSSSSSSSIAVRSGRVIALGSSFTHAAARWPSLQRTLMQRIEEQHERLSIQALILHLPRAEHRLLLRLWHLASKWGRVTPEGITLPFALTHEVLGQLIAARRPTVTLAIRELEAAGCVRRLDDGSWQITPAGEQRVLSMVGTHSPPGALGEAFTEATALRAEAKQARAQRHALRHAHTPN